MTQQQHEIKLKEESGAPIPFRKETPVAPDLSKANLSRGVEQKRVQELTLENCVAGTEFVIAGKERDAIVLERILREKGQPLAVVAIMDGGITDKVKIVGIEDLIKAAKPGTVRPSQVEQTNTEANEIDDLRPNQKIFGTFLTQHPAIEELAQAGRLTGEQVLNLRGIVVNMDTDGQLGVLVIAPTRGVQPIYLEYPIDRDRGIREQGIMASWTDGALNTAPGLLNVCGNDNLEDIQKKIRTGAQPKGD